MLNKILIIILLSFIMYPLIGQGYDDLDFDTLNQVDKFGCKKGYWIELLSKDFKIVKKEKKAFYFRFVYFQNDVRFDTKLFTNKPSNKKLKLKTDSKLDNEMPTILDGYYSFYIPKTNVLIKEFLFQNGHIITFKEYYSDGRIALEVDYKKKYKDHRKSCLFSMYDEKGGNMVRGYHVLIDGELKYIDSKKQTD